MANKQKDHAKSAIKTKLAELGRHGKNKIAKVKPVRSTSQNNTVADNRLELLITTVNRSKSEYFLDLLQSFEINMQFVAFGQGTADANMLSKFGFADSDKAVIFSVVQGDKLPAALAALEEKFRTIKNGKGIAYTIPFSSVIGTLIFGFLSNNQKTVKENKENT